jgi:hypothetical protein
MKRLIVVLCVAAFIIALPMSHSAMAKRDLIIKKVLICHATDSFDILANEWTQIVGHVIEVSENAVDAHLAHGDALYTEENDLDYGPVIFGLTWRQIAENNGLNTAGAADCSAFVLD